MTFKAANCEDVVRQVTQAGKPEFVSIASTAAIEKTGGTITISGTSNSKKLTFTLASGGTLELTLPATYTANSVSTENGADISGDPGASAEYAFSIQFANVGANPTITAKTCQLIVTDDGGHTATCTITQAAGDPVLSVSPTSVTLDWNAYSAETSASFAVTSNTNWTIE
jgi:phage tail sheath gpL-like